MSVSADDYLTDLAEVTVHDNETAVLSLVLPAEVYEAESATSASGTVWVPSPVADDVTVRLTVSDETQVHVPATVVIPAGETQVQFDLGRGRRFADRR